MLHMINTTPILNESLEAEYFSKSSYTLALSTKVIRNCKSGPILRIPYYEGLNSNQWLAQRLLRDVVLSRTWAKRHEY